MSASASVARAVSVSGRSCRAVPSAANLTVSNVDLGRDVVASHGKGAKDRQVRVGRDSPGAEPVSTGPLAAAGREFGGAVVGGPGRSGVVG